MSTIWISVLIALTPGTIALLYKLLKNATRLSHIYHTHADLDIAVVEQDTSNQKVKIKIAYAGGSPLIIRRIELTSVLSLARSKERFLAWFQLARGYLTDDWEGLQTVFGQNFVIKEPIWLRKIVNLILGILFSLFIISLLYNPFGWVILLIGPYSNLKIMASDKNINTKEMQTDTNLVPPFLIKPCEEREYLIEYTLYVKARSFLPTTEAKYVQDIPKKSPWKLPRPGQFVLEGNVKLLIRTSGLLAAHRISLSKKNFVLIPCRDNSTT